jgi:hypothetical protein
VHAAICRCTVLPSHAASLQFYCTQRYLFIFTAEVPDTGIEVEAFKMAAALGIHRTVHAGESGSAEMVKRVSSNLLFSTMISM